VSLLQTKIETEREELLKKAFQKEERDRVASEHSAIQKEVVRLNGQVKELQSQLGKVY
jgi:hypothetical protein